MVLGVAALLLLATAVDGRGRASKPGGKKDPDANNHLQQVRPSLVPSSRTRLPAAAPPRGRQRAGRGPRCCSAWRASGSAPDSRPAQALLAKNAEDIDAAIAMGADINLQGAGGQTPLMASVLQGNTENVVALLKHDPDVTIGEKDGYTAFHGVGFQGRADMVPIFMEHGLDPLDMHRDGHIGMHRACWGGEKRHTDTVEAFLKAGVPFDHPNANGEKPIDMVRNNVKTKKLLKKWAKKAAQKDEV